MCEEDTIYQYRTDKFNFNCIIITSLPMRMADSRSLLASLTGFVSALPPSSCPAGFGGTAGGGSGGGGGPGGGGTMRGPGGGTGGSG